MRIAVALLWILFSTEISAKCLPDNDPKHPCRYNNGDAWCQSNGRPPYAYNTNCLRDNPGYSTPGTRWLIIASRPSAEAAWDVGSIHSRIGYEIRIFRAENRWYAVALGPIRNERQEDTIRILKSTGKIPHDSFYSLGSGYHGPITRPTGRSERSANTFARETYSRAHQEKSSRPIQERFKNTKYGISNSDKWWVIGTMAALMLYLLFLFIAWNAEKRAMKAAEARLEAEDGLIKNWRPGIISRGITYSLFLVLAVIFLLYTDEISHLLANEMGLASVPYGALMALSVLAYLVSVLIRQVTTEYEIRDKTIFVARGILQRNTTALHIHNYCYLSYTQSPLERFSGRGTIALNSDETSRQLVLRSVPDVADVVEQIRPLLTQPYDRTQRLQDVQHELEAVKAQARHSHVTETRERVVVKHEGGGCLGCLTIILIVILLPAFLVVVFKVSILVALFEALRRAFDVFGF